MKTPISVTIITKNEQQNIRRCLQSLSWADEIIVVDSGSEDDTVAICEEFGCRVYQEDWQGFGKTKQKAVSYAGNDWIFSIDADEEVTDALRERIITLFKEPVTVQAFRVHRRSFYLGKMIKHSGWNKDYPLRIFNRNAGGFNEKAVHESVHVEGTVERLQETLLHFTYPTLESHLQKMNQYSTLGAQTLFEKGYRVTVCGALFRGKLKFMKMYLLKAGFLDGLTGFVLALNSAFGVFLKYMKLWKLNR